MSLFLHVSFWHYRRGSKEVHDGKTSPLHPHLRHPKHAGHTLEPADLLATSNIRATRRQCENVREGAGAGGGAQEHEPGGYAGGGAP